jgi:fumarate reductase flavoprotein subunit
MKELNTGVIVVGAGSAGLAAAIAAAEGGAKVIACEKSSTTGGAGNMAMGPFAVESRLQREKKYAFTREEAFRAHMDFTHWRVDARLVRAFIDRSGSTIDWLEKMGVEFAGVECHNEGFNFTWHTVKLDNGRTGPGAAAIMVKAMTMRAKQLGVEVLFRTPAKELVREGSRVVGLVAEDPSGEEIRLRAQAVVIATGGFGDNPDMIRKHTGYDCSRDLLSFIRIPGMAGNGIRMAWEAGAAPTEMTVHLTCGLINMEGMLTAAFTFWQPNLMVNLLGERFTNEEILQTSPFGGNAVSIQKQHCAFMIFDEETKRHYKEKGLDFPSGVMAPVPITTIDGFDEEMEYGLSLGDRGVFVADSIEELAEKTGVPAASLKRTVGEYNRACETGRDELFDKSPKYLRPVKQPKFYAAKLTIGGFGTLGGIKINHRAEAIGKSYDGIPGLYAAGVDANSINGDTYVFTLPGSTLGFAINSGRIAGENAAIYAKSMEKPTFQ